MVKKYGFSLCKSSEIILLVALYNTEACLRSCETKTHAHTARRSFNIRNTQLYKNHAAFPYIRSAPPWEMPAPPRVRPFTNYVVSDKASPQSRDCFKPGDCARPTAGAVQVQLTKN